MHFDWITDGGIKTVALAGICKNAGKTTLLNHLLGSHPLLRFGVFSTGIDGEEADTVFKHPKPPVRLNAVNLFCCDTQTLEALGSEVTVLEKLACSHPDRDLWLARAENAIQTTITGPQTVRDQVFTLERLYTLGAEKCLIDGSLDRKSIALSKEVDALIVIAGASFGPIPAIAGEIRRLLLLNGLPAWDDASEDVFTRLYGSEEVMILEGSVWRQTGIVSLLGSEHKLGKEVSGSPRAIYIPGAVTDNVLPRLTAWLREQRSELILRHPDCLKLGLAKLEVFISEFHPRVLVPFKIRGFALNSQGYGTPSIAAEEFRAKIRLQFPDLDLPDLMEMEDERQG
jgi:hypothetical protein